MWHTQYKILLCCVCEGGLALRRDQVFCHLKTAHFKDTPSNVQKRFRDFLDAVQIPRDYRAVEWPAPSDPPILGLGLFQGYCCPLCNFLTAKKSVWESHWSKSHRDPRDRRPAASVVKRVPVQKLIHGRYFPVTPSADHSFLRERTLRNSQHDTRHIGPILRSAHPTPYIRKLGWDIFDSKFLPSPESIQYARSLVALVGKQATPSFLDTIPALTFTYYDEVRARARDATLPTLKLLIPDKPRSDSWEPLRRDKHLKDYARILTAFLFYLIRSQNVSLHSLPFPVTTMARGELRRLVESLESAHSRKTNSPNQASIRALHGLLMQVCVSTEHPDRWGNIWECFLAVYCLESDGRHFSCAKVVQVISRIRYIFRNVCFFEACSSGHNLYASVKRVSPDILDESRNPVFGLLITTSTALSKLLPKITAAPFLICEKDSSVITYHDASLDLDSFRPRLKVLVRQLESDMNNLCDGAVFEIHIQDQVEDWNNDTVAYGWIHRTHPVLDEHPLLSHLVAKGELGSHRGGSRVKYSLEKCRTVMRHLARLNTKLAVLCHLTAGQPSRGAEFIEAQYQNTAAGPRTIFRHHGSWYIVIRRLKSSDMHDQTTFIPHMLPKCMSLLLDRYLLIFRPVEIEIAGVLYSRDIQDAYRSHLWIQNGVPMTSRKLTEIFTGVTRDPLGAEMTLLDWRHISVAISRTYLAKEFRRLVVEDDLDIFALQRGHSTDMARSYYAKNYLLKASLPAEALEYFTKASTLWHKFFELVDL